ncbi:hypothetical protein [Budvicia aquatica]|uniref:Uncharacterized protein n=1 Tax=Budvicia aquatica TaxID=82979 RepID=A0A484ZU83_9GAMM|nr:hypothetical protein [Budvicia aquatica]VFS51428.1 Uncharacterised protein [Budvicia aquatica]
MSIGASDSIESLDLQNVDKALTTSRDNIIANIAAASDTPALLIKDEAFANGFGEGAEDSNAVAQYIDSVRQTIDPTIMFFENIVQYIAWDEAFFDALAADYPDQYAGRKYEDVFYGWKSGFSSKWTDLLERKQSDVQDGESKILNQASTLYTALSANLDPENKAALAIWLAEIINTLSFSIDTPLILDEEALANYVPPPPVNNYGNEKEGEEKAT